MANGNIERLIEIPDWITVEGAEVLGALRVQEAIRGALRWTSRYGGLGHPLVIRPLDRTQTPDLYADVLGPVEEAGSGEILLDPNQLDKGNVYTYNVVLHAMTHASRPPNPTLLLEPLPFTYGYGSDTGHIVGYVGLCPVIKFKGGDREKYIHQFEEGMAERNASFFSEYRTGGSYNIWGVITRVYFPFDKFPNAHQLVSQNDVPLFVRTLLQMPMDVPIDGNHIMKAIRLYSNIETLLKILLR